MLFENMNRPQYTQALNRLSGAICILAGTTLSVELAFPVLEHFRNILGHCNQIFIGYFAIDIFIRIFILRQTRHVLTHPLDMAILIPVFAIWHPSHVLWSSIFVTQLPLLLITMGRLMHLYNLFQFLKFKPVHSLIAGFGILIFVGSLLLSLPVSITTPVDYLDLLFTAASAVCVTGLSTLDFATVFTRFGHVIVLALIQIGGIGFMTFTTLMAILMNQRLSHRETSEMQEAFMAFNRHELTQMIIAVFRYTLILEGIGTLCLFAAWHSHFPTWQDALFASFFHAVSAFCNAGFSLFSDNLMGFQQSPAVLYIISCLVFLGGIGFPVLFNLMQYLSRNAKRTRFRLQTKIAISMSLILIILGTSVTLVSEYHRSLSDMTLPHKIANAVLLSISPRTAGFNAIDLSTMHMATLFCMMILMFIGASPGSTGGGIKTTTLGVLLIAFLSTLRMQDRVEIGQRQIPLRTLMRATAIVIMGAMTIMTFCFILLYTERNIPFQVVLFETVSAFSTVGLSLGLTPLLSTTGKSMMILLMLIGRVGPFAAAVALASPKPRVRYQYPEEDILVA
jgi:trk system potassium uptake protein TrkH